VIAPRAGVAKLRALLGGNAGSARGAASLIRETISRVRDAGARGAFTIRADSAFDSRAFVAACQAHDVDFSVTVKRLAPIRAALEAIPEEAWVAIPYWLAGGADVAETTYTAFKGVNGQRGFTGGGQ
jgi:hypothetical protein